MAMTDVRAQYTEQAVGANHPTLADTINRLVKGVNNFRLILSGGNLTLVPVNGNLVDINDVIYACTAMPTLGAGGLTPGQLYYIYLFNNIGTETLEASATGYTVDAKGRAYKTGDATHRLMGMARPIAGPAWADSLTQRFVRSYNHRPSVRLSGAFSTTRLTASVSYVELNTEIRVELLAWADDLVQAFLNGDNYNTSNTHGNFTAIGYDGTTPEDGINASSINVAANTMIVPNSVLSLKTLAEGYHYVTMLGCTDGAGTGYWVGNAATPSPRTQLSVALLPNGE